MTSDLALKVVQAKLKVIHDERHFAVSGTTFTQSLAKLCTLVVESLQFGLANLCLQNHARRQTDRTPSKENVLKG